MAIVCETCGDEGFVEALVYCDSCKLAAVHRYCCGIMPVPIDDYVTWFCSDCNDCDTASDSKQVEHQDTSNVEVSSSPPMEEPETTREIPDSSKSNELTGLSGFEASADGASLLEMSGNEHKKKKKKKKRKIITHSLPDATSVETMEVSKKQDGSENGKSDELTGLARNELSVLEKTRKKKKKKTDKGEDKKKEETSNHFSPVLEADAEPMKESKKRKCSDSRESEELNILVRNEVLVTKESEKKPKKKKKNEESSTHTLPVLDAQDVTSVEAMKESTIQKCSESREPKELSVVVGNEASVLEKSAKKKKKKKRNEESSNHTSPVLKAVDCGHQDTTGVEAMDESKKHNTSDIRESDEVICIVRNEISIPEKSEKKKKKTNGVEKTNEEESSNHTAPVLAVKNHVADDTNNVEPANAQESSASRKPEDMAGLEKNGASISEGGNSTNVPDHNSCTTSKKRRLSSRKIHVSSENTELPAKNSSCKEAESNIPQTNQLMTARSFNSPALNNDRAQPICVPVWRGSLSVKQGNIRSIDGLVAHLSTLACHKVHEKAGSLHTRLSAQMFNRMEIWPPSFLKNGPPTDDSIALYFFPSPDSNGEKVYYSLVQEMKKNDLAMRCLLDDVELLLFTSYQLPLPYWKFRSKEYLWGIFRRRKTLRQ